MENFGIKLDQIIFQIINFFIILLVLKKFLYKPIVDFVKKQKDQQDEYLKMTQEIGSQKESLQKLSDGQKAELKKHYEESTEKARKEAQKIVEDAKEIAKNEGKRILAEYNVEAEQSKETILQSAKDEIYNKALNITEKLLKSSLTTEQKEKLMKMAMENLENE